MILNVRPPSAVPQPTPDGMHSSHWGMSGPGTSCACERRCGRVPRRPGVRARSEGPAGMRAGIVSCRRCWRGARDARELLAHCPAKIQQTTPPPLPRGGVGVALPCGRRLDGARACAAQQTRVMSHCGAHVCRCDDDAHNGHCRTHRKHKSLWLAKANASSLHSKTILLLPLLLLLYLLRLCSDVRRRRRFPLLL